MSKTLLRIWNRLFANLTVTYRLLLVVGAVPLVVGGIILAYWLTFSADARASLGRAALDLNPPAGKGQVKRMFTDFEGAYIHGVTVWVIAICVLVLLLLIAANSLVKVGGKLLGTEFKTIRRGFKIAYTVPVIFAFSFDLTMICLNFFSQLKSAVLGLIYGATMAGFIALVFGLPIWGLTKLLTWFWRGGQYLFRDDKKLTK